MKIIHVLAPAPAGGLERVVHALAIGQQRAGHEVLAVPIASEWTMDHSFASPLERANVDIRPVIAPGRAYLTHRTGILRILRDFGADVVHSHGYHADVLAGGAARSQGIASVSTSHGFTRGSLRNRAYEWIDRLALRRFDAIASVSKPLADELIRSGISSDRVHVIPNAWSRVSTPLGRESARRELGLEPDAFVAAWVGRMTPEKGLDVFIDALARLHDSGIRVCAVGDGPERAGQIQRAASLGVGERILWTGLVREAARYFLAFDVLVLSSRTEGVPMVVLEAIAAEVPVVATAVGGIPDVVSPNEALLVPSESPDTLAAAIRSVYDDRAAAGLRAREALSRLNRESAEAPWLRKYELAYEAARERAGRRRRYAK